jgi:hypothetical protein
LVEDGAAFEEDAFGEDAFGEEEPGPVGDCASFVVSIWSVADCRAGGLSFQVASTAAAPAPAATSTIAPAMIVVRMIILAPAARDRA